MDGPRRAPFGTGSYILLIISCDLTNKKQINISNQKDNQNNINLVQSQSPEESTCSLCR